jgi:FkbH-like protein
LRHGRNLELTIAISLLSTSSGAYAKRAPPRPKERRGAAPKRTSRARAAFGKCAFVRFSEAFGPYFVPPPAEDALKLIEALRIAQDPPRAGRKPLRLFLATGFTPLHLKTFLVAHLTKRLGDRGCLAETGLFGDLVGGLEGLGDFEAVAVVVELSDLDPRMGLRQTGASGDGSDILAGVAARVDRLLAACRPLASSRSLAVVLPTLPLPPLMPSSPSRLSHFEAALHAEVDRLALGLLESGARVAPRTAPDVEGYDVQSELLTGFPYTLPHASAVGEALARLLAPRSPRKALVTDLDETLWAGILGEVGIEGISWDLDHHTHRHALYQNFLRGLSDAGVLLAALSKNDPALVTRALEKRKDLLLPSSRLFPVIASWEGKATGFRSILDELKIGAEDCVFVDDSPMEIAEVRSSHPGAACLLFPSRDADVLPFLSELRDLLGRDGATPEDAIRAASLRAEGPPAGFSRELFLRESMAEVVLDFEPSAGDPRPLDLVNKTNQFNLNGRRYTEAEWRARGGGETTLLAGYTDKYGPLGRIGVLRGRLEGREFLVDVFVLSCRAFSRRVEHQMVAQLLERTGAETLVFDFAPTARNGPFADFLASFLGATPTGPARLPASLFRERCPPLCHKIRYGSDG